MYLYDIYLTLYASPQLKEIGQLSVLKNLQLDELRLVGNPVCSKYTNRKDEYVR